MSGRRSGLAVLGVVLALVAIVVLSHPRQDPYLRRPLDPRSTGPEGLAGVVALLRANDTRVRLGGETTSTDDVVLQVRATLTGGPDDRLTAWVRAGGTLVVTDPDATLAARQTNFAGGPSALKGRCNLDALHAVDELGVDLSRSLGIAEGDSFCFANEEGAGIIVRREGSGLVVTMSSIRPFLNGSLGRGDDAALAIALLAPEAGMRVRVLDPNRFVSDKQVGDGTVLGALPARARQGMLQLVIAFLVWGLVRGRRLGRVVEEELPVSIPSSDLVLAVGELLARGQNLTSVAERLRRSARRELGIALGLGADPRPDELVTSLTDHVSLDPAALRRALVDPVPDVETLVDISHQLDRLRKDLHDIHAPT